METDWQIIATNGVLWRRFYYDGIPYIFAISAEETGKAEKPIELAEKRYIAFKKAVRMRERDLFFYKGRNIHL